LARFRWQPLANDLSKPRRHPLAASGALRSVDAANNELARRVLIAGTDPDDRLAAL
jgi:hypothetical protein